MWPGNWVLLLDCVTALLALRRQVGAVEGLNLGEQDS
jgi:hypothetical protein